MAPRRFKINIEIPLLLSSLSWHIAGLVNTNFMIYRTCYVDLGYNESDCALLGNTNNNITDYLEPIVQEKITVMSSIRTIVESIIPLVICLCVGPWSDKFGRKPVLVVSHIGSLISSFVLLLICYFTNLSAWYIIFSNVPSMLLGSGMASSSVMMSYIVDSTPEEYRGFRFALIDIISDLANVVGNSSSSYIFKAIGYTGVFGIVVFCSAASALYYIFFIPESLGNTNNENEQIAEGKGVEGKVAEEKVAEGKPGRGKMAQLVDISNIKSMLKLAFEKRGKYLRPIILLLLLYTIIRSLSYGEYGLTFLYLRKKFGWTLRKYSLYNSFLAGISAIGVSSSIYILHKVIGISDSRMVILGQMSALLGCLLFGFAQSDVYIYIAGVVKCFSGVTGPMQKSFMSKLIPQKDIGKLFSLQMIVGFLFGLGSSPMFNMLYKKTLHTNPGVYNFVGAGFQFVSIVIYMIIMVFERLLQKRISRFEHKHGKEGKGHDRHHDHHHHHHRHHHHKREHEDFKHDDKVVPNQEKSNEMRY